MWEKLDSIKLCGIKRCKKIYIFSMCCAGTSLILSGWYQFSAITWNSKLRGTGNVMRVTRFSNMARAGTWLLAVHSWRLHVTKMAAAREQVGGCTWPRWRQHVNKLAAARDQDGGHTWLGRLGFHLDTTGEVLLLGSLPLTFHLKQSILLQNALCILKGRYHGFFWGPLIIFKRQKSFFLFFFNLFF